MTVQMKCFIELSDIVALRFSCKHCDAVFSLSLLKEIDTRKLLNCPNCNEPWARYGDGSSIETIINEAIESAKKMKEAIERRENAKGGFSIALELKE